MKKKIATNKMIFLLGFALTLLSINGCKKSKADAPPDVVATLQNNSWKLTKFTISPAYFGTTDVLSLWDECDKDNLYIFKPDNVFIHDEGTTKCDPGYTQQSTGYWSYDNTTKKLYYRNGPAGYSDEYEWFIKNITSTQFTAENSEEFNGVKYNYQVTFTKQ